MDIVLSPDPRLRAACETVEKIDRPIKQLAKRMAKTMYASHGVGLAAPQVGVNKRIVVVDTDWTERKDQDPLVLINPRIISESEETYTEGEGCLSIPGVTFMITRPKSIVVRATDLEGDEIEIEASEDLFCRCLQHEIDHINGITMFERLEPADRLAAIRMYQEALASGAQPGEVG